MNKTLRNMIMESERRSTQQISEDEITEEMIADRLKKELALFTSGTKPENKGISKRPADREVQPKKPTPKPSKPENKAKKPAPKPFKKSTKEE